MTIRSRISLIMGIIEQEHLELFALELGKIAVFEFVDTTASTNVNQSVPNLITIYMAIRPGMSSTMNLIRPEFFDLSAKSAVICP